MLRFIFLLTFSFFLSLYSENQFGYISYKAINVGDYIQAIAAKRFLPKNSIPINRELIGAFDYPSKVKTIMNGWYMHTKKFSWYLNACPPKKSWPPPSCIDPLLISMHITEGFLEEAFTEEGIEYFKRQGPIGARDVSTLKEFQKRNIPSYYSGCLTLTLDNPYTERDDIIYVVDLDQECIDYIKAHTQSKVKVLTHNSIHLKCINNEERLEYAQSFLDRYSKAKCVITSRYHVSMPCLALKTPVLLVFPKGDPRFNGNRNLVHSATREELLNGEFDFDFDSPPENSDAYLPIRENLIKTVTEWVKNNSL